VVCPEEPKPDLWYCLESSNTHTSAHHLFLDIVHRSHFGNRLHPFPKSPVIFIYRNPLDIVVSEANYYHEDGKTAFSGYLNHLCFEERLIRLIDDPWLLGTIMGSGREVRCLAGFPKCCSRIVRGVSGP
jgi:hypothetical protein